MTSVSSVGKEVTGPMNANTRGEEDTHHLHIADHILATGDTGDKVEVETEGEDITETEEGEATHLPVDHIPGVGPVGLVGPVGHTPGVEAEVGAVHPVGQADLDDLLLYLFPFISPSNSIDLTKGILLPLQLTKRPETTSPTALDQISDEEE